jgi:hypothetical protein
MSDEIVARKLRLIPQDLRIASPVHFSEVFTKPELATIFEQIDAGRIAHEAAALIERQQARIAELVSILGALYATVKGECPALLNEDSGGNAALAIAIESALEAK